MITCLQISHSLISLSNPFRAFPRSTTEFRLSFAKVDIMHKYGLLLNTFGSNGEYINNCILTMMHHVAGDLECVQVLYQPHILKVFSKIWETDYQLCDVST